MTRIPRHLTDMMIRTLFSLLVLYDRFVSSFYDVFESYLRVDKVDRFNSFRLLYSTLHTQRT